MTHTPGPWKYQFESVDPSWAVVTTEYGAIVANVNSETGPDATSFPAMRQMPADANARLIAAAPDLLAALVALRSKMYAVNYDEFAAGACDKTLEQARKAIVKATGE